jgi:hypothetical protein
MRDYEIQYWNIFKSTKKVKTHPYLVDFNKVKFVGSPLIAGWDTQGKFKIKYQNNYFIPSPSTHTHTHTLNKKKMWKGDFLCVGIVLEFTNCQTN